MYNWLFSHQGKRRQLRCMNAGDLVKRQRRIIGRVWSNSHRQVRRWNGNSCAIVESAGWWNPFRLDDTPQVPE